MILLSIRFVGKGGGSSFFGFSYRTIPYHTPLALVPEKQKKRERLERPRASQACKHHDHPRPGVNPKYPQDYVFSQAYHTRFMHRAPRVYCCSTVVARRCFVRVRRSKSLLDTRSIFLLAERAACGYPRRMLEVAFRLQAARWYHRKQY